MSAVASAWLAAVAELGGRAADASDTATELETRYGEAHRHYHDAVHVQAVLDVVAELRVEAGLDPRASAEVVLAACAHDVVHDGEAGADERRSAEWATAALSAAGVPSASTRRVHDLVLLTATHTCDPTDTAAAVLLDADLAVLGASTDGYRAYVGKVRAEYASVTDAQWRTGRGAVLHGLLDRDQIFATAVGRRRWEAAARANLAAELSTLEPPARP